MAVIMPEVEFPGLLVWVGFCGKRFVLVVVMTEVLCGPPLLVPAIVRHLSPGDLERQQAKHEEHEKASHGQHGNGYGPFGQWRSEDKGAYAGAEGLSPARSRNRGEFRSRMAHDRYRRQHHRHVADGVVAAVQPDRAHRGRLRGESGHGYSASTAGNPISNRVVPSAEDARIFPLCASTMDLVIARPSPAPSLAFWREGSTR